MSVAYTVEFSVLADQRERFMDLLTGVLDTMRTEPMFLNATLHIDPEDPNHFMLHETWRGHDDVLAVQLQRPYRRKWHSALPELLRVDRKIAIWTPVRSGTA